ncbi:hypothetical protein CH276_14145 [Rhodococcus sp. 06-470-2]|uniref:hypothetical protein n=1 Tax=unclassified Rhodococcus (in: high G+C Gram-positive bacteria) TaxID=192944 RepID=UPI000B9BD65D|nr:MULTISPECIES: hypothetical protein [unclassified Rhodococcus (in: high G+C Gram-positive bacteria)]OZC62757.1 hypothetical protein CH276_14145 [Rhodococcus sp. 06-470-2]OZE71734.1 hypothetical protein CH265_01625 [Rhodococcus sp. 05-2221-1B]
MTLSTGSAITIELPWTTPPLSMNDRGASVQAARAKAAQIAQIRSDVYYLAHGAKLPKNVGHAVVQLHYRPGTNARRDTDNLIATAKPIFDALAGAADGLVGYGLVPDDIPQFMSKPEPIIHQTRKGQARMWLDITISDQPKELPE